MSYKSDGISSKRAGAEFFKSIFESNQTYEPVSTVPILDLLPTIQRLHESASQSNLEQFLQTIREVIPYLQREDTLFQQDMDYDRISREFLFILNQLIPDWAPVVEDISLFLLAWTYHIGPENITPFLEYFQVLDTFIDAAKHVDYPTDCAVIQLLANLSEDSGQIAEVLVSHHIFELITNVINSRNETKLLYVARLVTQILLHDGIIIDVRDLSALSVGWYNVLGTDLTRWHDEYFVLMQCLLCRREFYSFPLGNGINFLKCDFFPLKDSQLEKTLALIRVVHQRQTEFVTRDMDDPDMTPDRCFECWNLSLIHYSRLVQAFSEITRTPKCKLEYFRFLEYVLDHGNEFLACCIGSETFFAAAAVWMREDPVKVKHRITPLIEKIFNTTSWTSVVASLLRTSLSEELLAFVVECDDSNATLPVLRTLGRMIDLSAPCKFTQKLLERWSELQIFEHLEEISTSTDVPQPVAELAQILLSQRDQIIERAFIEQQELANTEKPPCDDETFEFEFDTGSDSWSQS